MTELDGIELDNTEWIYYNDEGIVDDPAQATHVEIITKDKNGNIIGSIMADVCKQQHLDDLPETE